MEETKRKEIIDKIKSSVSSVIVGNSETIDMVITAILAGGHILLEDTPGTGKTMMAKAFSRCIGGEFKRVQFTPDLMPSDITGLNIFDRKTSDFKLVKGPVFTNILLADEINRATPRTQSSLLEAMEERQVTIDGETMQLDDMFVVIATENPVETIGTYPLPEAQLDRFMMKLSMGDMNKKDQLMIIEKYIDAAPLEHISAVCSKEDVLAIKADVSKIFVHSCVREYIVDIIMATRNTNKLVAGVSTRGMLALIRCSQAYALINGKMYVEPDDVRTVAPYVLGHRIIVMGGNHQYKTGMNIITDIVAGVNMPTENWEI